MNKTLFTISTAFFTFFGTLFSAAPIVTAQTPIQSGQTVNFPVEVSYDGLTFLDPVINSSADTSPALKATLTFGIPEKLQLTDEATKEVLGEVVLLPTRTTAMTLPVLPTQQPPFVVKDENDEKETTPTPSPKATLVKAAAPIEAAPTIAPATPTTAAPAIQSAGNPGGLDAEKLFNMSNAYRQSRGLPPFQKDERACSLAASRAPEVAGEVASGNMHAGLRARALPYWNTENIISMRTEESAFNWWVNDKIHHDAIVGNYTYSCVACSGNNCAQEFTNFQPK